MTYHADNTAVNSQDYNTYIFGDDAIFSVFLGKNPEDGSKNYPEQE